MAKRNSSIELLKIIGVFLIVISHVVQSLNALEICGETLDLYPVGNSYMLEFGGATSDSTLYCLTMFRYFGQFGNLIFLFSSVFFMLQNGTVYKKKILQLIVDIWIISLIFLITFFICHKEDLSIDLIISQLFPTTYANNWYLTCYILIYAIHPVLNKVFECFDRKQILVGLTFFSFLYIGIDFFIQDGHFFPSQFLNWILLYLIFGYFYHYSGILTSRRYCYGLIIGGIIGAAALVGMTNMLGLHTPFFSHSYSLLRWNHMTNPFLICSAVGLVGLFSSYKYHYYSINVLSSLILFVYLFHENMFIRMYTRPFIWSSIYESFGFDYIILWVLVFSFLLFIFSVVVSMIYKITINRLSIIITSKITHLGRMLMSRI